jgi:hypothetical protein
MGENGSDRFAPMAFLGSSGGGYSRISWPADTWYTDEAGLANGPDELLLVLYTKDSRSAQLGFGAGSMYIPDTSATGLRFLVTRDSGSSWATLASPALPDGLAGGTISQSGAVIRPYVTDDQPGVIVFTYTNYAAGTIDFLRTDGKFTAFSRTAGKVKANATLTANQQMVSATGLLNRYFTFFGGGERPYIFPAFPREFDAS